MKLTEKFSNKDEIKKNKNISLLIISILFPVISFIIIIIIYFKNKK